MAVAIRKHMVLGFCLAGGIFSLDTGNCQTSTLSNDNVSLQISNDNGAIYSLQYNDAEFFRAGTFVSDWGLQVGDNTATFAINNANGAEGIPVTVTSGAGLITASGVYSGGGANVAVTRSYSVFSSFNTVQISTVLLNNGAAPVTLRLFGTYDPDQVEYYNVMDVYVLGGDQVARATHSGGFTVIAGSSAPETVLASGGPFQISGGTALNDFFSSPVDANGSYLDMGIHIGHQVTLALGASFTAIDYLSFGSTQTQAESAYFNAVPEPASAALIALGLGALCAGRRRFRR